MAWLTNKDLLRLAGEVYPPLRSYLEDLTNNGDPIAVLVRSLLTERWGPALGPGVAVARLRDAATILDQIADGLLAKEREEVRDDQR